MTETETPTTKPRMTYVQAINPYYVVEDETGYVHHYEPKDRDEAKAEFDRAVQADRSARAEAAREAGRRDPFGGFPR